jgi:hypothetical protein
MKEEWKEIPEFDGYFVSSHGRVSGKNVDFLKPQRRSVRGGSYLFVDLRGQDENGNKIRKCIDIHRLVAAAFLGPCPPGNVVHHRDHDRSNPRLDNLEYISIEENNRY